MLQVKITADFSRIERQLAQLSGAELRQSMAKALNDAAFEARGVVQRHMRSAFDRPTPFIISSVKVVRATPDNLVAKVEPQYPGGKGVDPKNVLQAEVFGGQRKHKRAERALQRVGILQPGYSMVPGEACPLDQYGNVKGSFIVQLLSYFRAFGEQGYRANITDRRRAKLADRGRTDRGFATINGVVYFVAWGKLRSGKSSHLHYGIWSRSGIHGVVVKPIIMFVRTPSYRKRVDFFDRPVQAAREKFARRLRYHVRASVEVKS